jgi:hypothetical protein
VHGHGRGRGWGLGAGAAGAGDKKSKQSGNQGNLHRSMIALPRRQNRARHTGGGIARALPPAAVVGATGGDGHGALRAARGGGKEG